jgi:hypothetical protein
MDSSSSVLFFHIPLAVWSSFPSEEEKQARRAHVEEGRSNEGKDLAGDSGLTAEQQWEMLRQMPRTPRTPGTTGGLKSPVTPRTQAFNTLGAGSSGPSMASGALPLREKYSYQ